jgi:hypothetical protein
MKVVLFCALLCSGCDSSVSAEQACLDLASARCAAFSSCSPHTLAMMFGDAATCRSREHDACRARLVAPGSSATPTFEEGCALATVRESCADFFTNRPPLACIAPPGGLSGGAACVDDAQCAGGTCNLDSSTSLGTCGVPAGSGEPCSQRSCAHGLLCQGAMPVCVQPQPNGAACSDGLPCAIGGSCVGAMPSQMGTCEPAVTQAGATCDPLQATGPGCSLDLDLTCDPSSNTCVPLS